MKHHAQLAGGLSDPRDVVPRDEGTRVSGERSTTSAQPEAPPLRRNPALTPGRRLIQFRLAPARPAGGHLSRRQPRPRAGGRKVRTSGAGMVSNPSAAGGPSRPAPPPGPARPKPHPNRRRPLLPATAQPGAGGHSNSDGRSLTPGAGGPMPTRPVNQKTGAARGQSLFLSAFVILRLRRNPFAVFNPAAVQDSFPS